MDSSKDNPCGLGCPIRRSRDQRSLASTPGFSQRAASFIASQCQGIHQMPFFLRLIAKPVACRAKPRNDEPRVKTLFILPKPPPRGRVRPAFAASDTPSSPCQRPAPATEIAGANRCFSRSTADRPPRTSRGGPESGGGERNRTADLLLAKQALSQLSYTPAFQADS